MESNIIDRLYSKLKELQLWFTTDLDNSNNISIKHFDLDEYGDLTEKQAKQIEKEILNYVGDGAANEDEAIDVFIIDATNNDLINYTWALRKTFEEKPLIPGLEATEVNIYKHEPKLTDEEMISVLTESLEDETKIADTEQEDVEIVEEEPTVKEKEEIKSVEDKITERTQSLYNKLVDAGYTVDISTDNGNSEVAVELENGQVLVNINDPDTKLVPVTSGSIVLNDKNEEKLKDIKKIIINESKKLTESELSNIAKSLPTESTQDNEDIGKDVTGVVDGILVITDPDITSADYDELIEKANEIIEGTPEGEIPFIEDYLGQYIQTCPICGKTFVTKTLLSSGDPCPLCLEEPQDYVTVGRVESNEQEIEREELQQEINEDEIKEDEVAALENDIDNK